VPNPSFLPFPRPFPLSLGALCFALLSGLTVLIILVLLAADFAVDGEMVQLGDLPSAASYAIRLAINAALAALFVWEGAGLLDLLFFFSSVLCALAAAAKDDGGGIEWSMAISSSTLLIALQAARWRARAWVERTLVSQDTDSYAARCEHMARTKIQISDRFRRAERANIVKSSQTEEVSLYVL
jgi:hypothetical protein